MHGCGYMKAKYSILALTAPVVLVADQLTKLYIDRTMKLYQSIPVVDGLFSITYLRNKGAAFSFLSDASWRLPFFILATLIAVIAIITAYCKLKDEQRFAAFSLSLILSGAIGNLIDRVRMGEVVDFLDVYWRSHHWPAFNVADSCICIAVGIFLIRSLFEQKPTADTPH